MCILVIFTVSCTGIRGVYRAGPVQMAEAPEGSTESESDPPNRKVTNHLSNNPI